MVDTIAAQLMRMKVLLDRPKKLARGAIARDAQDRAVYAQDRNATSWCLVGAGSKVFKCNARAIT